MNRQKIIPGFTGSEIERAAMVSSTFPKETALERTIKQKLANSLKRLANSIDPAQTSDLPIRCLDARC